MILVEGNIRNENYTGNDGTKKYVTYVLANNIEYLESKKKTDTEEVKQENNNNPFEEFGEQVSIDDMSDNFLD